VSWSGGDAADACQPLSLVGGDAAPARGGIHAVRIRQYVSFLLDVGAALDADEYG